MEVRISRVAKRKGKGQTQRLFRLFALFMALEELLARYGVTSIIAMKINYNKNNVDNGLRPQ